MDRLIVIEQQSLLDIAIQQYGTPEGVEKLVADNAELNLGFNSNVVPGTKLNVENDAAIDEDIVNYFKGTVNCNKRDSC